MARGRDPVLDRLAELLDRHAAVGGSDDLEHTFLASRGDAHSPLITRVEVPRHGKSLAFLRGLLEQNGRKLLSYSATIKLRSR